MPLLYVDLLGMKARWHDGGVEGARAGYREFEELVVEALAGLPRGTAVSGGVQSDAAVFSFEHAKDAVSVGRRLLREAFAKASSRNRTWIRGVILDHGWPVDAELERVRTLKGAPAGVFTRHFKRPLLEAINLEQSGFRGQRLLVANSLVTHELKAAINVEVAGRPLALFRRLLSARYPTKAHAYQDVLWMLPDDLEAWPGLKIKMLDALRWASRGDRSDPEFLQASATHLVFAEVDALVYAMGAAAAWRGVPDATITPLWYRLQLALEQMAASAAKREYRAEP